MYINELITTAQKDAKNMAALYQSLPHPDWMETFERVFIALREQYEPFYVSEFNSAFYEKFGG